MGSSWKNSSIWIEDTTTQILHSMVSVLALLMQIQISKEIIPQQKLVLIYCFKKSHSSRIHYFDRKSDVINSKSNFTTKYWFTETLIQLLKTTDTNWHWLLGLLKVDFKWTAIANFTVMKTEVWSIPFDNNIFLFIMVVLTSIPYRWWCCRFL
jgi:hypothetical protein